MKTDVNSIKSSRASLFVLGLTSAIGILSMGALTLRYHRHQRSVKRPKEDEEEPSTDSELPAHLKRAIHKEKRRKASVRFLAMKKPMYDNLSMYGPQGDLLCTISQKKADWYVRKQLASWKGDATIQLLFEPKGKSSSPSVYATSHKQNVCVCCGEASRYMRHYVVPYCYRTLFPENYKTHMPHDIIILCADCHLTCAQVTQKRQKRLEYTLRKNPETAQSVIPNRELHHVRSCALALVRNSESLPQEKQESYESLIKAHFGLSHTEKVTSETLQAACEMETHLPNPNYIPGAQLIVDGLDSDELIDVFIRDWRAHFVETMHPRFLPKGWSVNNPVHSDDSGDR